MEAITVPLGERSYNVLIGDGLLAQAGEHLVEHFGEARPQTLLLVSDETVFSLYGKQALASLGAAGFACETFVFTPGEASKSLSVLGALLEFCAAKQLTGGDALLALGGGVVGDVAGFAAAIYRRGLRYIQLPTTLLAAVDSSVGGKTAVNLRVGKNLAGAFWQPSLVLCDPLTHRSLPPEIYADGVAECLKYGVLFDETLFAAMEGGCLFTLREKEIARCVGFKRDVVARDEHDIGERRLLNLGHTLGHAIEQISGFAISHGAAVGLGMALITRLAQRQGWCADILPRLCAALEHNQLPTECRYPMAALTNALRQDKKRVGDKLTLVVPQRIGNCRLKTLPLEEFQAMLEELQ
ncbi:MAG: 3-dehydroquinate synthase [Oscillospiraceae bacterium]|nr:3-dehydroquinate synthase [Oscillospiraceae bacterium]